ncbi:MAG TPA: hypothetical protein VGO58_07580 [Chitinophagaceae bacterium]|nr:hypothetical protein [Chitinophagaceae bacterium]
MKKLFLIAIICLSATICFAQFGVNLAVSPQPPGALLSWGTKDLTYIVSGGQPGAPPRQVLIKTTLTTSDGTPVATTNLSKARIKLVGQGTAVFYAADVIPLDAMVFTGKYKTSLDKTGKLPSGTYQLCVQLVTPVDFFPQAEERCRTFLLAAYQLPIPMMPANEDVMEAEKAQTAITFRWTPLAPKPAEQVKYIVTVFEVLDKQTPMQALRSNQPLLTKEIIGTTQFIWQPQLSFIKTKIWDEEPGANKDKLKAGDKPVKHVSGDPHVDTRAALDSIDATTFIWTIQTVNFNGIPFGDGNINGDGISEPNVFTVIKDNRRIKTGPPAKIIYQENMRKLKPGQQIYYPPIKKD